jgi:LytS/YehU family sensor histidine kinase
MLRYQLNPHFLFNTLNAISTLVLDRDNETANLAVISTVELSAAQPRPRSHEKGHAAAGVGRARALTSGIEQLRFGSRLTITQTISDAASQALVPSLLLQPLVENSLKYAVGNPRIRGAHSYRC